MAAGQNIELVSVFTYLKSFIADVPCAREYEKVAELLKYGITCFGKVAYCETSR
jgi:hypothetical protein